MEPEEHGTKGVYVIGVDLAKGEEISFDAVSSTEIRCEPLVTSTGCTLCGSSKVERYWDGVSSFVWCSFCGAISKGMAGTYVSSIPACAKLATTPRISKCPSCGHTEGLHIEEIPASRESKHLSEALSTVSKGVDEVSPFWML